MSIYLVTGNKGGVGKSFAASAMIDLLIRHEKKVVLIDSDPANTDVLKAHKADIECHPINLSNASGWIDLVNLIAASKATDFVINTPAGFNASFVSFGQTLLAATPELNQELRPIWVINRQRDSLEALSDFQAIAPMRIVVVRNLHYGTQDQFELYNTSKIKAKVEVNGCTVDLPDIADRVADQLISERLSIAAAHASMPIGNRMELQRWRNVMRINFEAVIA